ncbi:MAG: hypothetical protein JWR00_1695 [Rubritepida sp.]|nr:hypothetical protein [Rubritepida sp.]
MPFPASGRAAWEATSLRPPEIPLAESGRDDGRRRPSDLPAGRSSRVASEGKNNV